MRLIDADKLPITETWALVNGDNNSSNELSFAPLSCILKKDIANAPTVELDSSRPQGKWIHKEISDDYKVYGQCSICKQRKRIDNFCPNCGASMRKETKNDD